MSLDRAGTATAFRDLFLADTGNLYGVNRLLQKISSEPEEFDQARASRITPNVLYIWVSDSVPAENRMQNADDLYSIDLRFASSLSKATTAIGKIDDAFERVKVLVRNEMYNGSLMTSYYTDSSAQFVNIEMSNSALIGPEQSTDETVMVFNCEAAITAQINRWV